MARISRWAVLVVLILGLAAVGGRLYWLQVMAREQVLDRSYVDHHTLEVLNRLLRHGVVKSGEDGEVSLDEAALEHAVASSALRTRVRRIVSRAHLRPGQKEFDPRLCRVLGPGRRESLSGTLRGRIMDRNGLVLAESLLGAQGRRVVRHYPLGAEAQQLLGFHHPVYGRIGLEAALNALLAKAALPAKDTPCGKLMNAGTDVYLTVDARLQEAVAEILGERRGAAVALDVKTGGILAAVGKPAFDPNFASYEGWRQARGRNKGNLLVSKPWGTVYPPGSTFKLVVAAAWLERQQGNQQRDPVIICRGRDQWLDISDISPHGRVDLDSALARSCNIYFARLGQRLGPKVRNTAERFGFNRPFDLLPQSEEKTLYTAASLAYARWGHHGAGSEAKGFQRKLVFFDTFVRDRKVAAQCAIGQNQVWVTPLQMAVVAQAIANDGQLMLPHLLQATGNLDRSASLEAIPPVAGGIAVSHDTARRLRSMMANVMLRGTGRRVPAVEINGKVVAVAGKTGTAETGRQGEAPHSWFVGFAPTEEPRVAIAVVIENGGMGSRVAAPLAARMLQAALTLQQDDRQRLLMAGGD